MGAEAGERQTGQAGVEGSELDKTKEQRQWNTDKLSRRLGTDVACAATAGGLVAPLIMTVDKFVHSSNGDITF